jgi:hypothetical protein
LEGRGSPWRNVEIEADLHRVAGEENGSLHYASPFVGNTASLHSRTKKKLRKICCEESPLPMDDQPSTERGTHVVLLTCGTVGTWLALPAPRGDS